MKKIIIGAIGAGCIAAGIGSASPAQAAPGCVINSTDPDVASDNSICGIPNLQQSVENSLANLKDNLNVVSGSNLSLKNLKNNLNGSGSLNLGNLQHALTHGVGSDPDA